MEEKIIGNYDGILSREEFCESLLYHLIEEGVEPLLVDERWRAQINLQHLRDQVDYEALVLQNGEDEDKAIKILIPASAIQYFAQQGRYEVLVLKNSWDDDKAIKILIPASALRRVEDYGHFVALVVENSSDKDYDCLIVVPSSALERAEAIIRRELSRTPSLA